MNKAFRTRCRNVVVVSMIGILSASLLACGAIKKVEVDIPDKGLNAVQSAAPTNDYAFYVSSASVPESADALKQFGLVAATGDETVNRAVQIGLGLGISNISSGTDSTKGLKLEANTLVVTRRTNKPPSGAVEITFK